MRALAIALDTRGHLASLRRLECSGFSIESAVWPHEIETAASEGRLSSLLVPLARALPALPDLVLEEEEAKSISLGRTIPLPGAGARPALLAAGLVRLLDQAGRLVAVGRAETIPESTLRRIAPVRVFHA